jgi:type II secretory pathway pseudopilin PulG
MGGRMDMEQGRAPSTGRRCAGAPGRRPTVGRRRAGGFTLVEVMVAVGVLFLAVVAAFGSQLASFRLMSSSREDKVAMADLAACMEEILVRPVAELPLPGGDFAHDTPVAAYENLHLRNQRLVATYPGYTLGGVVPDPLQILLTATWRDGQGHTKRLELRSLRVR